MVGLVVTGCNCFFSFTPGSDDQLIFFKQVSFPLALIRVDIETDL